MSYPGTLNAIQAADSQSIDAFGRWRVSNPVLLLSGTFTDDNQPLIFESATSGGGESVTHLPNESSLRLRTTANGEYVLLQSRQYYAYRTGQSQAIDLTWVLPNVQAGINYEIGYGDDNNGIFLTTVGTAISVTQRSYATGVVDNRSVAQASWNIDTLGAGALNPSGITLDPDVAQIFYIDLQWLGVGRVRVGFVIGGLPIPVHEFLWSNEVGSDTVYMTTARLPVRWKITNVSAGAGTFDLKAICAKVEREGSEGEPSNSFASSTGTTVYSAPASLNSLCAVRPAAANPRVAVYIESVSITVTGANPVYWQVVRNPTLGVALTYGAGTTGSLSEVSSTHTTVSGGTVIAAGHVGASAVGGRATAGGFSVAESLPAVASIAGTPDQYVLAVYGIGGASNCYGTLNYREIR